MYTLIMKEQKVRISYTWSIYKEVLKHFFHLLEGVEII